MQPLKDAERATYLDLSKQVDDLLVDATPAQHESFFDKFLISNTHRKEFVEQTMVAAVEERASFAVNRLAIPNIIHRLWLTDVTDPKVPREYYIERIAQQVKVLSGDYQYIFWHNCDAIVPMLAPLLPEGQVSFRNISSLSPDQKLMDSIQRAIAVKKYVMAGDMTKYMIINECGGIYGDLGVDFREPLLDLIKCVDVSLFLDRNLFFQPAFMAAPAKHQAFRTWCDLLVQPEVISAIGLSDCDDLSPGHEIWMHGGVGFTAALMLFYDSSFGILSVPANQGSLHHESEGSWYQPGNKFGNASIHTTPVSHLDRQTHQDYVRSNEDLARALPKWKPLDLLRLDVTRHLGRYWLT